METLSIEPIVEEQTSKAVAAANDIKITDSDSYDVASDALAKIKKVGKLISDKQDLLTKPLNAALKEARDLYRPFIADVASAETIIKRKMIAYRDALEAEARRKEAALQARVEKEGRGRLNIETAVQKAAEIQRVEPTRGENYRKIKKVRIIDLAKIPAKYFVVDEVALRRDALALGQLGEVIPGVVVEEVTSLAA